MQKCPSVRITNISYTKLWLYSNTVHYLVFLSSFFSLKFSKPVTLGPELTHSDSERCCFSPTLLENDPSVSQQVDLYLLHGSYCKIAQFCGKHQPEFGDFALRQNPLRGNSEQSTPRIKGSQRNGRNSLFKLAAKLSMTLVCYRNSICLSNLSFCFNSWQTWAESGSKAGKKGSAPSGIPY